MSVLEKRDICNTSLCSQPIWKHMPVKMGSFPSFRKKYYKDMLNSSPRISVSIYIYTVCIWTQIQNPKLSNYTPKTLCAFLFPKKTPITSYYIKSSLSIFQPTFDRYSPHDFQAESPEESYPTRTELQSINDMKSRCCDKQHLGLAFFFKGRSEASSVGVLFGMFCLLEGVP